MGSEKSKHRDSLKVTDDAKDDAKAPPRDRDQSAISPQRAEDIADKAEFSDIPGVQDTDDPGEGLLERDHLQDPPSAGEQRERDKPVSVGKRGPAKTR
jgi:hypothetical protein